MRELAISAEKRDMGRPSQMHGAENWTLTTVQPVPPSEPDSSSWRDGTLNWTCNKGSGAAAEPERLGVSGGLLGWGWVGPTSFQRPIP